MGLFNFFEKMNRKRFESIAKEKYENYKNNGPKYLSDNEITPITCSMGKFCDIIKLCNNDSEWFETIIFKIDKFDDKRHFFGNYIPDNSDDDSYYVYDGQLFKDLDECLKSFCKDEDVSVCILGTGDFLHDDNVKNFNLEIDSNIQLYEEFYCFLK